MPGRALEYQPLDLGFHPEATRHTDRIADDGTRFLLVEVDPPWVGRLAECTPGVTLEPRMCGARSAALAVRLYREYRSGAPATSGTIEGIVLEMLADLRPAGPPDGRPQPRWLPTVLEMIRSERPAALSLGRIAREVRLHPVYLSRSFRQRTGRSVSECLIDARIRFAARKLASPDAPLAEIALDAGFADQSHFTKVFRRETGMTPGAFRDSLGSRARRDLRRPLGPGCSSAQPRCARMNAAASAIASSTLPASVRPERAGGLKEWSPCSIQWTRISDERP